MISEKYEDAADYADQASSRVSEYFHRGSDRVGHMVGDRPGSAMLMACLAGFGVGLLLSRAIPQEESSYFSSSMFDRGTAERLGRNVLEKIESVLPSVLRDRLTKS